MPPLHLLLPPCLCPAPYPSALLLTPLPLPLLLPPVPLPLLLPSLPRLLLLPLLLTPLPLPLLLLPPPLLTPLPLPLPMLLTPLPLPLTPLPCPCFCLQGNRRYTKCLYVYNKVDMCSVEEVNDIAHWPNSLPISCSMKLNMAGLLEMIWDMMALVGGWVGGGEGTQPHPVCGGVGGACGHVCGHRGVAGWM